MTYTFETNDRPFKAIKAGTKTVEGRTPTSSDLTPYDKLTTSDFIIITNNSSSETLAVKIRFVHHYATVKDMLKTEGVENVLSSEPKTVAHGIESYHSLTEYEDGVKKNGIYAIGLELL
jgi:ASC-1-like (ASCH) protein